MNAWLGLEGMGHFEGCRERDDLDSRITRMGVRNDLNVFRVKRNT